VINEMKLKRAATMGDDFAFGYAAARQIHSIH